MSEKTSIHDIVTHCGTVPPGPMRMSGDSGEQPFTPSTAFSERMARKLTITVDAINMGHQWEYCSVRIDQALSGEAITEELNNLGRDRWELVATPGNLYHFKRKLVP